MQHLAVRRDDLAGLYTFGLNGAVTATTYSVQAVPQGVQAAADTTVSAPKELRLVFSEGVEAQFTQVKGES